ncbi:NADP-dependent oxidoreductase [Sandarakinorhabdus limnophila]|uniref:NADP-dependent oxidoreductase n=1 Tax=Sandarakinorhabdus limnophila TaxID=210512 RepID=UPI0026F102B2|nr:NADP-dependent oxidoreductase [Sandarakinorhabdus limnophila]
MTTTRRWLLKSRPNGPLKDSDFDLVAVPMPNVGEGQLLVRLTHFSFDPTQRGWLGGDTYLPAVPIGGVVRAGGVGEVVASKHPGFEVGDVVQGTFGWQEHALTDGTTETGPVTKLRAGITPEQALGVFGVTGLTAWFGLTEIGQPKAGDTVLVSGAAGATGSVVVQVAKALGCKVIGIAGGAEKCGWVVEQAGADACIDYRAGNVARQIREYAPKGVNLVFENVGGEILDAALANLALRARVVLCGGISSYNDTAEDRSPGLRNYMNLTVMRGRMEGFIILDFAKRYGEGVAELAKLMAAGKLKTAEDVAHGFDNCPATLRRLFEGKNFGKQLLKL